MQDSNLSSKQNSQNKKGKKAMIFAMFFLIVSLLGFTDSTYLAIKKLTGSPVTCTIVHGCDTVTSSVYSEIFGIPIALLGSFFYLSIILLSVAYLDKRKEKTLRLTAKLTWIGLFASSYFVFVQAVLLQAWCIYCIGSAITSTILFIIGMCYLQKFPKAQPLDASTPQE
jgi:uncharacterized membrane protein